MDPSRYDKRRSTVELSLTQLLEFPTKWKEYKLKFKKKYTDEEEEKMRKQIFFQRYKMSEEHNKRFKQKLVPFRVMVTEYSDLTEEEIMNLIRNNQRRKSVGFLSDEEEWNNFKTRTKKKFKSKSEEDIPRCFFMSRINEMKKFKEELDTVGLRFDSKEMDKYCDFDIAADVKTVFGERVSAKPEKARRSQDRKSSILENFMPED